MVEEVLCSSSGWVGSTSHRVKKLSIILEWILVLVLRGQGVCVSDSQARSHERGGPPLPARLAGEPFLHPVSEIQT